MAQTLAQKRWQVVCVLFLSVILSGVPGTASAAMRKPEPAPRSEDGKLRIICFGAHPDDNEFRAGGAAALWAAQGHHVKFVSVTNGDIGHWGQAGGPWPRDAKLKSNVAQRSSALRLRCLTFTMVRLCPHWRTV